MGNRNNKPAYKIMIKLIKLYLMTHPWSSSKQIHSFFKENNFGVRKNFSVHEISMLIRQSHYDEKMTWFQVETRDVPSKGKEYRVIT